MRHAAVAAAVVVLFQAPHTSAAQSGAERAALSTWEDSLAQVSNVATLPAYEAVAHRGAGAAGDIRLALFQLRKAQLNHDRGLTELALIRLDAISAGHSGWPWPEYLLGRTFLGLSDQYAPVVMSAGLHEGESHVEAGWRHLRYAITTDPAFAPARRFTIATLVPEGDRELRGDEVAVVRLLLRARDPEADALLVGARDARTHERYDSALTLLNRAVTAHGEYSRLQLERARTLHAIGDTAQAAAAYWDGLAHLTPAGREMYRHDLAWIVAPDSLKLFDAVPFDSLPDWIGRFWAQRDAAAANAPGQRLQEHFRRWTYAFEHYRVILPWRHNQFTRVEFAFEGIVPCIGNDSSLYNLLAREQPAHPGDIRHREPLLDHRGLMYLHHGQPFRVAYGPGHPNLSDVHSTGSTEIGDVRRPLTEDSIGSAGDAFIGCARMIVDHAVPMGPNESWMYWIDGDWRLVNFRASCALGLSQATTLASYLLISPSTLGDWLARADLLPEYHDAAHRLSSYFMSPHVTPPSCLPEPLIAVAKSRADADVATQTDSHTPLILHPWGAVIQAFALGAGENGEALVTFAIPADSLQFTPAPNGEREYDFTARIVGYDRVTGRIFSIDTVRHIPAAKRVAGREHLSGWFEFALDPGDWQIGIRMHQGVDTVGAYALAAHVQVPEPGPLSLSDIVTGNANGLDWPAPDAGTFRLNVLGAWPLGGTAEIYYEVHGLGQGESYHVVTDVRGIEKSAKDVVRIESTDRATGRITAVRKSLGLERLKPGVYRLIVSIDAGPRHASREQRLLIVKAR